MSGSKLLLFDEKVFQFLFSLSHRLILFDWLLIFLAKWLIAVLVIIFLWLLIRRKDWRERFYFFSLSVLSLILSRGILTPIIRYLHYRPRPFTSLEINPIVNHDISASFPSGHLAFILPIVLTVFLMDRRKGWWFLLGAILMGVARVAVGVHWPSDILGGIGVGLISFFAVYYLLRLKGIKLGLWARRESGS